MDGYSWNFQIVFSYYQVFVRGFIGTLKLTGVVFGFGLFGGLLIGMARWTRRRVLRWPAIVFIEVFRNVPALVLLIWFFYAFPILIGMQLNAFTAAALAMSLNVAAFSAETFRAGLQSVRQGQWDAGRALGMSFFLLLRRIILPQAFTVIIPALTNRAIDVVKITALASTIAYGELLYEGKLLSGYLYRPLEIYTMVAVIYFVVLYAGTLLTYRLEKVLRVGD